MKKTCTFEGCIKAHKGHGWCTGHIKQWRAGKTMTPLRATGRGKSLEDYFWWRAVQGEGCWNWTGELNNKGYTVMYSSGKRCLGHRYSYELHHRPLLPGEVVDHTCRTRHCVNPKHLRAVSQSQNMQNLGSGSWGNNSTGVRGVSKVPGSGRYRARVKFEGITYLAGTFDSVSEAEEEVKSLRNKLYTHNDVDRV